MKLSKFLSSTTLLLAAATTNASPLQSRQAPAPVPAQFYLQTQVYGPASDSGTNKNGLYVGSYHTGAGLGVAAGYAQKPTDAWFYMNETADWSLYWTYTGNTLGAWPVKFEYGAYQEFNTISISIADGPATSGYFVNGTGLQANAGDGWLACDWWLSAPQIFVREPGYSSAQIPSSCSQVYLQLVPNS